VLIVIGAIGAVTRAVEADAEPAVISSTSVPAECKNTGPENADSVDADCRDYLYQVQCQFTKMAGDGLPEAWEDWCTQNTGLEHGDKAAVPKCGLTLAGEKTAVGERCRDFIAHEYCTGGHTSVAEYEDFCADVAPSAGADPVPVECTTEVAHEPSAEGNRCWSQLKDKYCTDFNGNTGAQDLNDFCEDIAAGAKPPSLCELSSAGQGTAAARACTIQLYEAKCNDLDLPPPEYKGFCETVDHERESKQKATERKQAGQGAPPAESREQESKPSRGQPEVLLQLGEEPACKEKAKLSRELQRACALTGSVMHKYPFADYGIDNNVDVEVVDVNTWFMSLFQWLLVGAWQILIWLVKVSLLLLQWAFAVDPLSRSGDKVGTAVKGLFDLIGPEWRLTALAILGVWGFWNGLVRRRIMQTVSGIALSMLLMLTAMWVVYDPEGTVGKIGHLANDSSVVMLSATSSGQLRDPEQGLAEGQNTLFDQLVEGPWCALQFGGQAKCDEPTSDEKISRKDVWLSMPANSSARELFYKATNEGPDSIGFEEDEVSALGEWFDSIGDKLCIVTAGSISTCDGVVDAVTPEAIQEAIEDPDKAKRFDAAKSKAASLLEEDPSAVELQGEEGAFTRAGLLAIIAIGIIGAVAFFFSIGVRLLVAGVILLLLILLAPVMLIVAAFGEEGRRRFIAWLKMLLGAAVAKLVYSVLFGVVLLVVFILIDLAGGSEVGDKEDWLGCWLLVSAFFWVAVLQMNRILSLFTPDPSEQHGMGNGGLGLMYMGQRMVSQTMNRAWSAATLLPRRAVPRAAHAVRSERLIRRDGNEGAIRARADGELDRRATAASLLDRSQQGARAREILGQDRSGNARRRMRKLDKALKRTDLSPDRRASLETSRRNLDGALHQADADRNWARWQLQSNRQQGGAPPSAAEVRARRDQRQQDVAHHDRDPNTWNSESNRLFAGITDTEWSHAQRAGTEGNHRPMQDLRQRSEQALREDGEYLRRADRNSPLPQATRSSADREWGGTQPRFSRHGGPPRGAPPDREYADHQRTQRAAARRQAADRQRRRRT
jgi:hypothetical protein